MSYEQITKYTPRITTYLNSLEEISLKSPTRKWEGKMTFVKIYYLYLLNKYKSLCLGLAPEQSKFSQYDILYHPLTFYFYNDSKKETSELFNNEIAKEIVNCIKQKKPLIFSYISLRFGEDMAHANLLIYRLSNNTFEHFEPHGQYFSSLKNNLNNQINKKIKNFVQLVNKQLKKNKLPETTLVESNVICPQLYGYQTIEAKEKYKMINGQHETGGYCAAWTLLFVELILKNPNLNSIEINQIIFNHILPKIDFKKQGLFLKNVIRGLVLNVYGKIEKYLSKIFDDPKIIDEINKSNVYPHVIDFLINIELNKHKNKKFNFNETLRKMKMELDLIKDKNKFPLIVQKYQKSILLLENKDVFKDITPPTKSTTIGSKTSHKAQLKENNKTKKHKSIRKEKTNSSDVKLISLEGPAHKPKSSPKTKVKKLPSQKKRLPRCPNGTRRNKKTGNCEPHK